MSNYIKFYWFTLYGFGAIWETWVETDPAIRFYLKHSSNATRTRRWLHAKVVIGVLLVHITLPLTRLK